MQKERYKLSTKPEGLFGVGEARYALLSEMEYEIIRAIIKGRVNIHFQIVDEKGRSIETERIIGIEKVVPCEMKKLDVC